MAEISETLYKYKWWIVGGIGGLVGLYILMKGSGSSASGIAGLSGSQAAVDQAALQAETQQAAIVAATQAASQQAAVQTAQQQAAVQQYQIAASNSGTNTATAAQTQQSIAALNDNTILQLGSLAYGTQYAQQIAQQQSLIAQQGSQLADITNQLGTLQSNYNTTDQWSAGANQAIQNLTSLTTGLQGTTNTNAGLLEQTITALRQSNGWFGQGQAAAVAG